MVTVGTASGWHYTEPAVLSCEVGRAPARRLAA